MAHIPQLRLLSFLYGGVVGHCVGVLLFGFIFMCVRRWFSSNVSLANAPFLSDLYREVVGPCVGARLTRGINLLVLFSCVLVGGFRSTQPSPILLFSHVYNVES